MKQVSLDELPDDLAGFKISSKIEVVQLGDDGQESRTIGYFKDPQIAQRILKLEDGCKRISYTHTIITNGEIFCYIQPKTSPF